MAIQITQDFDGGAIKVLRAKSADAIEVNLRPDSQADFMQWFYFRVQGVLDERLSIRFMNAGKATFPEGWQGYRAVASYDQENWFRVPTRFDDEVMTIEHTAQSDSIWFAYFEPYSMDRHQRQLEKVRASAHGRVESLGPSLEGRDIDMLVIGDPDTSTKVWVVARQHPGETMAEWFVEGMVDALLDPANPFARELLRDVSFYVVPNMNPDGSVHGNLRTNAAGANLNREWMHPSLERSPEVFRVRERIHATGCDLFLDIHGDEALPYVFLVGANELDGFSAVEKSRQARFCVDYMQASPDLQDEHGYAFSGHSQELLSKATPYVSHAFGCLSLTLEMPFKDNANAPSDEFGWSGARSAHLGKAALQPILQVVRRRRNESKHPTARAGKGFWSGISRALAAVRAATQTERRPA